MRIVVLFLLLSLGGALAKATSPVLKTVPVEKTLFTEPPFGKPHIFPNPAVDFIQLADPDRQVKSILVYNLLGRQMMRLGLQHGGKYDISSLPNGIYLIQMVNAQGQILATQRLHKR